MKEKKVFIFMSMVLCAGGVNAMMSTVQQQREKSGSITRSVSTESGLCCLLNFPKVIETSIGYMNLDENSTQDEVVYVLQDGNHADILRLRFNNIDENHHEVILQATRQELVFNGWKWVIENEQSTDGIEVSGCAVHIMPMLLFGITSLLYPSSQKQR